MTDAVLRRPKEFLLGPIARSLPRAIHPLSVTLLGLVPGVGAAIAAADGRYVLALVLWLTNRTLDGLDGTLARAQDRQSDLGAYVDIHADFLVYAAVPLGLAAGLASTTHWMATAALLAVFYVNTVSWAYLSALLERRRMRVRQNELTSITMPGGLVEGAETIAFYCAMLAFPGAATTTVWVMVGAVGVTVAHRFAWAARNL